MTIEWDSLVVEMTLFAVMVYGAIYVESWLEKRKIRKEEDKGRRQIIQFVTTDLQNKLRFIEESIKYQDFKPFFTDMWDAVILGGKQILLPFQLFEKLQHTYSWMKYYNNEVEQHKREEGSENDALEVLGEVRKSIEESLKLLKQML